MRVKQHIRFFHCIFYLISRHKISWFPFLEIQWTIKPVALSQAWLACHKVFADWSSSKAGVLAWWDVYCFKSWYVSLTVIILFFVVVWVMLSAWVTLFDGGEALRMLNGAFCCFRGRKDYQNHIRDYPNHNFRIRIFECNAARPLLTALSIIPAECKRRHGISGD